MNARTIAKALQECVIPLLSVEWSVLASPMAYLCSRLLHKLL
jgi:hypothetical protein